ncbi:BCCT family transporter [Aquimarina sp. ERC-38]|uniref:BCCT family transporter n=1 Tax=Aquimarina sp. ERC-38 TaxID=2949996 RepID=UPI0022483781|nr:BCCT family transporter [Aquimarina sp. ERC-38]UZO79290.1 BCCT family transporter [Aquimarina sp. ERC-38]
MYYLKRYGLLISISLLFCTISYFFVFKTEATYYFIEKLSIEVRNYFGHYYLYLGFLSVFIVIGVALLPAGKQKLGKSFEKPSYSRLEWVSMLYSAGMGAGILLRAVQEPVFMKNNPPIVNGASTDIIALEYVFYHWGFTAWAFYALFAIIFGYAIFVRDTPVKMSSTFYSSKAVRQPTFINKAYLSIIDLLCIFTTIFGLVAAIGLGTTQIEGGLAYLFDTTISISQTVYIVLGISIIAGISAYAGISRGIKLISKINIYCTVLLLLFVLFQENVLQIISRFFIALYHYIIDFIPLSLALGNFNPGTSFLTDWTYYYWAFWLAWAPFTGIFIARISRGRTIRELVLGVLLIPSLGTFFWFTTFGTAAFEIIKNSLAYTGEFDNVFTSVYQFFSYYPYASFVNSVILLLLVSFLVTSLDSAIFVLSMFTDGGKKEPGKKHRLIWTLLLTLCTIGIIFLGNSNDQVDVLIAMQKLLIITSLPFSLLMIVMIVLFFKTLYTTRSTKCS